LFAGAHEVLQALQPHYQMHIITNGFKESSDLKLSKSNLKPYFTEVFVSEVIGKYKPDIALFQHALAVAGCEAKDAIMIGDSLEADILGAKNAGIDQIFFNPHLQAHTVDCNYEIAHLSELLGILT
jgi:putative hydrolase of the HAD superfamily